MWRLKLWSWWLGVKNAVSRAVFVEDDGTSFADILNDGLPWHEAFWKDGHLVRRTKYGVQHFDDNCPQERDARLYAARDARRQLQEVAP